MPNWNGFVPDESEYDSESDKLHRHRVTIEEATECFQRRFVIRANKRYTDRYKLLGSTHGGRHLCIIFQLKKPRTVRIITGWEV